MKQRVGHVLITTGVLMGAAVLMFFRPFDFDSGLGLYFACMGLCVALAPILFGAYLVRYSPKPRPKRTRKNHQGPPGQV